MCNILINGNSNNRNNSENDCNANNKVMINSDASK